MAPAARTSYMRYTQPYDWHAVLAFFRARAIDGVEDVGADVYRRSILVGRDVGSIEVRNDPSRGSLAITMWMPRSGRVSVWHARVRRAFDTDADTRSIRECFSRDPVLAPLVAARPGLRVPGAWEPFELGIRAILGQQITVEAARRLASRLTVLCGTLRGSATGGSPQLSHAFPTARQILEADLASIGMPAARRAALKGLAQAAIARPRLFRASGDIARTVARLRAVPGIGEWTAQYIALRASREPDAFPATDIGLIRGAAVVMGARPSSAELLHVAEAWRPWRAYAAQHLWAVDAEIAKNGREARNE